MFFWKKTIFRPLKLSTNWAVKPQGLRPNKES